MDRSFGATNDGWIEHVEIRCEMGIKKVGGGHLAAPHFNSLMCSVSTEQGSCLRDGTVIDLLSCCPFLSGPFQSLPDVRQ